MASPIKEGELTKLETKAIRELRREPSISLTEACKRAGSKKPNDDCTRIFKRDRVQDELSHDRAILRKAGVHMYSIAAAIARGLNATKKEFNPTTGEPTGQEIPDHYTQLQAAKLAGQFLKKFGANEEGSNVTNQLLIVLNNKAGIEEIL